MTDSGLLRDGWRALERLAGGDLRLRFLSSEKDAPAIGLDYAGRRHLVFPIEADAVVVEDRQSGGVQIARRVLEDEKGRRVFVDVVCAKAHLDQLFDIVAGEMIAEVAAESDRPDVACRRVLDRWRELLDREAEDASGVEKVIGVFGELFHLRELVRIDPRSVDRWTGPTGSRHDFNAPAATLEVKATQTRHGRFFEISSHDQLEPLPSVPLYLGCLKLERAASGGNTLNELITDLIELGADRAKLKSLVAQAGIRQPDLEANAPAFRVIEHRVYEVDSSFPAVTSRSFTNGRIPSGVMRLRYLIDLSSEPPNAIPEFALPKLFGLIAGVG